MAAALGADRDRAAIVREIREEDHVTDLVRRERERQEIETYGRVLPPAMSGYTDREIAREMISKCEADRRRADEGRLGEFAPPRDVERTAPAAPTDDAMKWRLVTSRGLPVQEEEETR